MARTKSIVFSPKLRDKFLVGPGENVSPHQKFFILSPFKITLTLIYLIYFPFSIFHLQPNTATLATTRYNIEETGKPNHIIKDTIKRSKSKVRSSTQTTKHSILNKATKISSKFNSILYKCHLTLIRTKCSVVCVEFLTLLFEPEFDVVLCDVTLFFYICYVVSRNLLELGCVWLKVEYERWKINDRK